MVFVLKIFFPIALMAATVFNWPIAIRAEPLRIVFWSMIKLQLPVILEAMKHGHGIRIDGVTKYSKYYIHNNIISGFNDVNDFAPGNCGILTYPVTDSVIAYVDNNTIYNCKFGIWNRGGESGYDSCRVILRNNIFQDPQQVTFIQILFISWEYLNSL